MSFDACNLYTLDSSLCGNHIRDPPESPVHAMGSDRSTALSQMLQIAQRREAEEE